MLTPNVGKEKREAERKKQREAKSVYLGTIANKVLDAIEKIFDESTPKPNGNDMLDVMALVPVFLLSRQIGMQCKSRKTMQLVMQSAIWALNNNINMYAKPLIERGEAWDELLNEEGGDSDGSDKG